MKKHLLLFTFIIAVSGLSFGQVTFEEVWAHYGENAPAWFTDGSEVEEGDNSFAGTERGIVYSDYSGHLYVSSRHAEDTNGDEILDQGEPHVYVLDPLTGLTPAFGVTQLLTAGIRSSDANFGGGYPLNNVTATVDGSIFACNMTLASGPDIIGEDNAVTVKAFRVYRWSWEQGEAEMIIDYKEGGYRLGDKLSVIGNWDTEAYIYAGPGESKKLLRWKVTEGIVDDQPTVISLQDITTAGTSITVADIPDKPDWIYVSGKGFMPTLFTTDGVNLSQVAITTAGFPSSVIAGRTVEFGDKLYMGMFSGDQSAFIFDISKHGENVTDVDVIGFTPTFGTRFDNAYGEGAVEFGVFDNELHVFICAPSNGIACYKIRGLPNGVGLDRFETNKFNPKVFPNPVEDVATIRFSLPQDATGPVSVKLYDLSGKFVGIIADKALPGEQELSFDVSQFASGTYIFNLIYDNQFNSGKLVIK